MGFDVTADIASAISFLSLSSLYCDSRVWYSEGVRATRIHPIHFRSGLLQFHPFRFQSNKVSRAVSLQPRAD